MGPSSVEDGKFLETITMTTEQTASMGPSSVEDGKVVLSASSISLRSCFNGAVLG